MPYTILQEFKERPLFGSLSKQLKNSATHLLFQLQYHEILPNNILFCPTQNIYILHEFKEGPPIWFLVQIEAKK